MPDQPLIAPADIIGLANTMQEEYANVELARVNDHVIRMSVMTSPYHWHYHPDSDETFIGIEGVLIIELESATIELSPLQTFTVGKNVVHRTRPSGERSVNLTVEAATMQTIMAAGKSTLLNESKSPPDRPLPE